MVTSRFLGLLCMAAAVILSEAPGVLVASDMASTPLRQLMEEVVKVHVMVHQEETAPAKKHSHKHHKKEGGNEEVSKKSDSMRSYGHGSMRIQTHSAKTAKALAEERHEEDTDKQTQNDETVVEYQHGSVKISGGKQNGAEDTETERTTKGEAKTFAAPKEVEVTSTANGANKLELSSTISANGKSFHDAYGPIVVICGIIGGLAAIIGVAGLVMDQSSTYNLDSSDSAELDLDVVADGVSIEAQNDDSDSSSSDDEDEDDDTFTNDGTHVSV